MADNTNTGLTANQNFVELDFFNLKESLKDYLKKRPEFLDYDFDGSTINLLLDSMTFNTQNNAFYFNLLASEFFLGTAQKRESVVSRAQELGYTSRSAASAKAVIDIKLTSSNIVNTSLIIPAGTVFTTSVDGKTYKFVTLDDVVSTDRDLSTLANRAIFAFYDVAIYEGSPLVSTTIISNTTLSGVVIPNQNIDTSLLRVTVAESASVDLAVAYSPGRNLLDINPNSNVYFVEEINDQLYRISFGDGNIGKAIATGNKVVIKYLITSGSKPNGARLFTLASTIPTVTGVYNYSVVQSAQAGADIESIESVRFNAPLIYSAQNRAVVPKDYLAIINREYTGLKSVVAWGGEDNVPIALGYVFISIKPTDRESLTNSEKQDIETNLKDNYCPAAIIPIVVDPELIYLNITATVKYNPTVAVAGPDSIKGKITTAIVNYGASDLDQFSQYFRYSKLSRQIDGSDIAVNNNNIVVEMEKRFVPSLVTPRSYNFFFRNPVKPEAGVLSSNKFTYKDSNDVEYPDAYFTNDIDGTISINYILNNTVLIADSNVGRLDFTSGSISINNFLATRFGGTLDPLGKITDIRIKLVPLNQDIYPVRNVILVIDQSGVVVNMLPDNIS